VPEHIQMDMTPENLARSTATLLQEPGKAQEMRAELLQIKESLTGSADPLLMAANIIAADLDHATS
jgi:lipid A disaccharide synthetase